MREPPDGCVTKDPSLRTEADFPLYSKAFAWEDVMWRSGEVVHVENGVVTIDVGMEPDIVRKINSDEVWPITIPNKVTPKPKRAYSCYAIDEEGNAKCPTPNCGVEIKAGARFGEVKTTCPKGHKVTVLPYFSSST
jgi:hypothetical protein